MQGEGRGLTNHAFPCQHALSKYCRSRHPQNSACKKELQLKYLSWIQMYEREEAELD